MSTVVILQPGYLPWLGFFDQLHRADIFVYDDDVQYDKHGWRNRNRIKTQTGPLWLTVPIRHGGAGFPRILDVEIDTLTPWARKHVTSIPQAYARAPFLGNIRRRRAQLPGCPAVRAPRNRCRVAALCASVYPQLPPDSCLT